jgi:hypothetical protein
VFFVKTPTESPSSRPKRRDLLFLFCPSTLTAPNKSHRPPLCHPERTRISYLTALPAATYAALRKESRMTSTEATAFDRKSGGAEGPAVRPGSRTKVSVPLVLPQNRHPERSASLIDRVTQRLWRGVEGPRRCLSYACCTELFNTKPAPGFPWSREPRTCRHLAMSPGYIYGGDPVTGPRWSKNLEQHA